MAKGGVSFELGGVREFALSLEGLSTEVRKQLAEVLRDTAHAVRDKAASHAPRDRGDLAKAIQAQGRGLNWRVGIVDERIASRGGRNSAHLNPSVYGIWYEYGFVTRKIKAHRFMGPAVEEQEPMFHDRAEQALNTALKG